MESFYNLNNHIFPNIRNYGLSLGEILPEINQPVFEFASQNPNRINFCSKKNINVCKNELSGEFIYTGHIKNNKRHGLGTEYYDNNQVKIEAVFYDNTISENHCINYYSKDGKRIFIGFVRNSMFNCGIIYDSNEVVRFIGNIENKAIHGPNNYIFDENGNLSCFGGFNYGIPHDEKFHILYKGGEYIWFIGHAFDNDTEGHGYIQHPSFYALSEQFFPMNRHTSERRCLINAKTLKDYIDQNSLTRILHLIKEKAEAFNLRETYFSQIFIFTNYRRFKPDKKDSRMYPFFSFFRHLMEANIIFSSTSPMIREDLDFYKECLYYGRNLWLEKDIPFQIQSAPFMSVDIVDGKLEIPTNNIQYKGGDGIFITNGQLDISTYFLIKGDIKISTEHQSNSIFSKKSSIVHSEYINDQDNLVYKYDLPTDYEFKFDQDHFNGNLMYRGKTGFFKVIKHEFQYIREYDDNFKVMFEGGFKNEKYDQFGKFAFGNIEIEGNWKRGIIWGDCRIKLNRLLKFQGKAWGINVDKAKELSRNFPIFPDFCGEGRLYDRNGKLVYQGKFNNTINIGERYNNNGLKSINRSNLG